MSIQRKGTRNTVILLSNWTNKILCLLIENLQLQFFLEVSFVNNILFDLRGSDCIMFTLCFVVRISLSINYQSSVCSTATPDDFSHHNNSIRFDQFFSHTQTHTPHDCRADKEVLFLARRCLGS